MAEDRSEHLHRVLCAVRNVNQLITKEQNREKLIKGACDNLVETRGYFNAWIVLLDESGKLIAAAESGIGKVFLPFIKNLKSGKMTVCGKKALKTSEVVITENPDDTCLDCPLSIQYSDRGGLTARLEHNGNIYGLTSVSIQKEFISDQEEIELFKEVSDDIAFALHNLKYEKRRQQAEEDLSNREQFITDIFESIQEGISVLDSDLKVLHVNNVMNQWYKENLPLEGKKCYKVYHNAGKPCDQCPSLRALKSGKTERDVVPGLPGSPVENIELFSYPLKDKDSGEIIGVVEFVRDITERKKAEEASKSSEERLKILFEYAPDAYYLSDLKGIFLDGNRASEVVLGYKRKELIGKSFLKLKLLSAKELTRAAKLLVKNLQGKPTGPDDFTLNRKDGSHVHVDIMTYPVKIKDKIVVLGIARDITESVKAKEELKKHRDQLELRVQDRTEELEKKNKELERFNKLFVGREFRIKELRDRVKELEGKANR